MALGMASGPQTYAAPAKCHSACWDFWWLFAWKWDSVLNEQMSASFSCDVSSALWWQLSHHHLPSLLSHPSCLEDASCKAKELAIHSLWKSLPHQDGNSNLNPRMWRGQVLCLSFWVSWSISVVLTCPLTCNCWLPIFWSACFVGTRTTFHTVLVKIRTQRSWERYQDQSHRNSSVNNPVKSCQTFSLQTYGVWY